VAEGEDLCVGSAAEILRRDDRQPHERLGGRLGHEADGKRRYIGTPSEAEVLTAELTAILLDTRGRQRTSADPSC